MNTTDLELQEDEHAPRIDGLVERKVLAVYEREARDRYLQQQMDRYRRRQTLREMVLVVLVLAAFYLIVRTWVLPDTVKQMESACWSMLRRK
jgi:hypothetical protein